MAKLRRLLPDGSGTRIEDSVTSGSGILRGGRIDPGVDCERPRCCTTGSANDVVRGDVHLDWGCEAGRGGFGVIGLGVEQVDDGLDLAFGASGAESDGGHRRRVSCRGAPSEVTSNSLTRSLSSTCFTRCRGVAQSAGNSPFNIRLKTFEASSP